MRHALSGRKFNRKSNHRKAMFMNLSNALILNEQIKTTVFKAKDLRPIVEKIITLGKKDTVHTKRKIFSILRDKSSVRKVVNVLSKRYLKRPGGYTRIIKAGFRYGDSSPMAIIEFLDRDRNSKGLVDRERLLKNKDKTSNDKKIETTKKIDSKLSNENTEKNLDNSQIKDKESNPSKD